MKELFSLKGRTALITGGSRGIGRIFAEGFLAQGATVYISARKASACDQTAAELSKLGPCTSLAADVSTLSGAQALHGHLRKAGKTVVAKVINIASIDGVSVNPQETYSYAASKAGLIHLTRRMALRLIKDARDRRAALAARVPSGRLGTVEDMAGATIFLASRTGDYVVGSMLSPARLLKA